MRIHVTASDTSRQTSHTWVRGDVADVVSCSSVTCRRRSVLKFKRVGVRDDMARGVEEQRTCAVPRVIARKTCTRSRVVLLSGDFFCVTTDRKAVVKTTLTFHPLLVATKCFTARWACPVGEIRRP